MWGEGEARPLTTLPAGHPHSQQVLRQSGNPAVLLPTTTTAIATAATATTVVTSTILTRDCGEWEGCGARSGYHVLYMRECTAACLVTAGQHAVTMTLPSPRPRLHTVHSRQPSAVRVQGGEGRCMWQVHRHQWAGGGGEGMTAVIRSAAS